MPNNFWTINKNDHCVVAAAIVELLHSARISFDFTLILTSYIFFFYFVGKKIMTGIWKQSYQDLLLKN
jgi:hypothetical protein